jgi:hypothetical protein
MKRKTRRLKHQIVIQSSFYFSREKDDQWPFFFVCVSTFFLPNNKLSNNEFVHHTRVHIIVTRLFDLGEGEKRPRALLKTGF